MKIEINNGTLKVNDQVILYDDEVEENTSDLKDDVEYLIIQNEKTGEEIAKITSNTAYVKAPYIIRTKYK